MKSNYDMSTTANAPMCEGQRLPVICEVSGKNADVIRDINAGMDTLLELLIGAGHACDSSPRPTPACLLDDITIQSGDLNEIHAKLSRALASLSGER